MIQFTVDEPEMFSASLEVVTALEAQLHAFLKTGP